MPKVKLVEVKAEDVFDNKVFTKQEIAVLKAEIDFIVKSRVWQILTNTLGDRARKVMFENATTFDDMRWGKAILYAIDIQQKIMEKIKKS